MSSSPLVLATINNPEDQAAVAFLTLFSAIIALVGPSVAGIDVFKELQNSRQGTTLGEDGNKVSYSWWYIIKKTIKNWANNTASNNRARYVGHIITTVLAIAHIVIIVYHEITKDKINIADIIAYNVTVTGGTPTEGASFSCEQLS